MFMALTILPLRLLCAFTCVASYYVTVRLATIIPNEIIVRRIATAFGKFWSRACLFCVGFIRIQWVKVPGSEPPHAKRRSVAVVSNHMGWADILIQMSRYFPAFVARDGTQHLPMIGLIR
jgi:lysophosphatidylcholine acyltransferase/lyso-PAF acetyltransferase